MFSDGVKIYAVTKLFLNIFKICIDRLEVMLYYILNKKQRRIKSVQEDKSMKQYYVNGQQFIKYTSRKEAAKFVDEIKENCVLFGEDNGLYADNSLYIEYTDGSYVCLSEGEPVAKLRRTGIKRLILSAEWGEAYYNAYAELCLDYPDMPYIRIAEVLREYGELVDLDAMVKEEIKNGMDSEVIVEKYA